MAESTGPESKLIIPFDFHSITEEKPNQLLTSLEGTGVTVKIGTTIAGDRGWRYPIQKVHRYGLRGFADTKADDIPQTVEDSVGFHVFPEVPYLVNMHASSGEDALAAFIERRNAVQEGSIAEGIGSLAIAVTVLTSKDEEIDAEYNGRTPEEQVLYYTDLAIDLGFDGVVCSPQELEALSGRDILKVTPGIRPLWARDNDQQRVTTPAEAVRLGATHLVIGRPITKPPIEIGSSENAIESILQEMSEAAA